MSFILRPTIAQVFLERAKATPDRVAIQYRPTAGAGEETARERKGWRTLTFRQFFEACEEVSNALLALGLLPGDRVALISPTRWEWSLFDLAIQGAGGVTVPIYPSNTREDMAYILRHSGAAVAVVSDAGPLEKTLSLRSEDPKAFPGLRQIICIEREAIQVMGRYRESAGDALTLQALRELGKRESARAPGRFAERLAAIGPGDPFTICYTSGTTGVPKGVVLTHDSLMSVLEDAHAVWGGHLRDDGELVLSVLPFSHILGRVESLALHVFGWRQAFGESLETLPRDLRATHPTLLFAVPRLFEKARARVNERLALSPAKKRVFDFALDAGFRVLAARERGQAPALTDRLAWQAARIGMFRAVRARFGGRLRFAVVGGAPMPKDLGEFFHLMGVPVFEGYGLTETCAPVTLNTPDDFKFGTVGHPLPEVALKIAPDGEVLVKSRKVFREYYKDPATTAETLRQGWLRTGDIGEIDSKGYVRITDRKKDLIVTSAGKNIAPQKIEALAAAYPWISQLVVYGDRRNYLTALITLHPDQVRLFAARHSIPYDDSLEWVRHPQIVAQTQAVVDLINQKLASYETLKGFLILPQEFSVEAGELTPSLKVKRNVVTSRYRTELDRLYPPSSRSGP